MHQLPQELLSRIYEIACTDQGQTGRSLALVSKAVNITSKPYKLLSVGVIGPRKICAFANMLEKIEKGGMGRGIVHLRIELRKEDQWPSYDPESREYEPAEIVATPTSRTKRLNILSKLKLSKPWSSRPSKTTMADRQEARLKHEVGITDAFFQILAFSAPTLQSLNFTLYPSIRQIVHYTRDYPMPMPAFPSLRALIPNHHYNYHRWILFDEMLWPWYSVPSLEVLDLTGFSAESAVGRERQYARIRQFAPSLRELRISIRASHGLGIALGMGRASNYDFENHNTLPSTLRCVYVTLEEQVPCQVVWNHIMCTSCARNISSELIRAAKDIAVVDDRVRFEGGGWKNVGLWSDGRLTDKEEMEVYELSLRV